MRFGFMIQKGIIDSLFILRMLQEEYCVKGNYMCFVELEKTRESVGMGDKEERNSKSLD